MEDKEVNVSLNDLLSAMYIADFPTHQKGLTPNKMRGMLGEISRILHRMVRRKEKTMKNSELVLNMCSTYAEAHNCTSEKVLQDMEDGKIDRRKVLDAWLKYEGIVGYTDTIIEAIEALAGVSLYQL